MLKKFLNWWHNFCIHSWQYSQPWGTSADGKKIEFITTGLRRPRYRGCVKCCIQQEFMKELDTYAAIPGNWFENGN